MDLISYTTFTHVKRLLYNVELSTLVNIGIPTALRSCAFNVNLGSPAFLSSPSQKNCRGPTRVSTHGITSIAKPV